MIQILNGLKHLHTEKKFFEIGELTEENIHLSALLSTIYIDPGFFYVTEDEIPNYLEEIEDEEKSAESDIYQCGFLFLRLITLLEREEIDEIFNKKFERKKKKKINFSKETTS